MSNRSIPLRNLSTKKPRVEEFNDLWDDDLDGDVIDDCFKRATQVCQEDRGDVTLLTSYSVFKEPKNNLFTSTQASQNQEGLEEKVKLLQEKFAEKEGEISILRTNLNSLRASSQADQEKKQKEWTEKLIGLEKENRSVKSELEFKNLEVVNLKQQIAELSRYINTEQNSIQKSKINDSKGPFVSPKQKTKEFSNNNCKIHINTIEYFPLKHLVFSFLCKQPTKPFENGSGQSMNNNQVSVYPEISCLIKMSHNDLESQKSIDNLRKVIYFLFQQLKSLHYLMKEVEKGNHLQDLEELHHLHYQNNSFTDLNELGQICGEITYFLAEVIPFSTFLKKYFVQEQQYILLFSDLIGTIGKTQMEKKFSIFLSGTIKFLCKVSSENTLNNSFETITQNIFYLKPETDVIAEIVLFLSIVTRNYNFVYSMCSKISNALNACLEDSCRFRTFVLLLEDKLHQIEDTNLLSELVSNVLNFIYNLFRRNISWLNQDTKLCDCFFKLYKLGISVIYKSLKCFKKDSNRSKCICKKGLQVLSLLSYHSYDLTHKYDKDIAQFKEIVYLLSEICDKEEFKILKNLEKLSAAEDFPTIPREKFMDVDL